MRELQHHSQDVGGEVVSPDQLGRLHHRLARGLPDHGVLEEGERARTKAEEHADRRATAALLSWHFHGQDVTIMVHDRDGVPSNHFDANHSWQHRAGSPLLVLSESSTPPIMPSIEWQGGPSQSKVVISRNKSRNLYIHKGIE